MQSDLTSIRSRYQAVGAYAGEPSAHPVVRARTVAAGVTTAITLALAIAMGVAFGPHGVVLFGLTLPVPLLLLWTSADVLRSDEEPREHE